MTLLFFLFTTISIGTCDFVSPPGFGLSRISADENAKANEICGVQPGLNKMNNGSIAKRGQFPWAVVIENKQNHRHCSGTIISPRHVLTAAHCVLNRDFLTKKKCEEIPYGSASDELYQDLVGGHVAYGGNCNFHGNPNYPLSTAGSFCSGDDMERVLIRGVAWERAYRDRNDPEARCTNYDFAIVEVASDFQWSNLVRPACLTRSAFDYNNLIGTFYGFGMVDSQFFPELRYGAGKIFKEDRWRMVWAKPLELSQREREATGTSNTAHVQVGDSGGGITTTCGSRTFLIGVIADSMENYESRGAQVDPHIGELCQLLGVCPEEKCA